MSQLESILSQIYGIVQTSYIAAHLGNGDESTIKKMVHPHVFTVSVSWTGVTILAFIVFVFIFLASVGHMVLWVIAVRMLGGARTELELLQPLDLMTYSIQASDRLRGLMGNESASKKLLGDRGEVLLLSDMDDASSIYMQSLQVTEKETKIDPNELKKSGLYRPW